MGPIRFRAQDANIPVRNPFVPDKCVPGQFVSDDLFDPCVNCPPGSVSTEEDAPACSICLASTYSAPNRTVCIPCPGTQHFLTPPQAKMCIFRLHESQFMFKILVQLWKVTLKGCSLFKPFAVLEKQKVVFLVLTCSALCTDNSFAFDEGSKSAKSCMCGHGFYSYAKLPNVTSSALKCVECPMGATCRGRDALPVPDPGFWAPHDQPSEVYECEDDVMCPGGFACGTADGVPKYMGVLCAHCASGFFTIMGDCYRCM